MESPVVVDKPPEYHGNNDRGFPFEEEEGSGAWSELAARHPDIAARLRQRPATATWARKRRPASQEHSDDFGDGFGGFDRFPFDDIPPEFREHFPTQWSRRPPAREEPAHTDTPEPPPPAQHSTAATQTEHEPEHAPEQGLPQYGLRNTVDLGQRSAADPSLVDGEERSQRSVSAPPAAPAPPDMSHEPPPQEHASNVRHIPIFVEGRDEPVLSRAEHEPKPHAPPPHIDRDQYFADDGPHGFHHAPNFSRAFGTPFNKGFRQGPQPFTQQKAYPQNAFARGASPQRAHSPKQPPHDDFVKVPVHHEHDTHKQPHAQQQQQQQPPQPQPQQPPQQPQRDQTPPRPQPTSNDPITQILSIQTDVLNLMTEVENFKGTKKDKRYLFLDEMLTRNLIKLDNIETEGKENIRQARKEAIKCIQKCIAVLEAKAEGNAAANNAANNAGSPAPLDVDMTETGETAPEQANGEVDMKDAPKETENVEPLAESQRIDEQPTQEQKSEEKEPTPKPQEKTEAQKPEVAAENVETQPPAADTRPDDAKPDEKTDEQKVENKPSPKKKVVKKRDKSKDTKAAKEGDKEASKDSNKTDTQEAMQVDDKGDKVPQVMEIDGGASQ